MKKNVNIGYLVFLSFVAALGGFLFGYDTAVILRGEKRCVSKFGRSENI